MISLTLRPAFYPQTCLKNPHVSDLDLIERIKRHDEEALSELYDRYRVDVYSLALHVTYNTALAEEVTQDTFMKVWMRATQYQDQKGRLRSWLLVITRRAAIDVLRRESRMSGCDSTLDAEDFVVENVLDIQAEDESAWREMALLLEHLPAEQRQVIELSFYRGLSQYEIAEHLGIPLGTIKTRGRLGMNKLREAFCKG